MTMQRISITLCACCVALAAASDAISQSRAEPSTPLAQAPAVARRSVEFIDLPTFDRQLAQSLSGAKEPVVVMSADRITLRQIPPRLEKWLSAVDQGGGRLDVQSVDPQELQPRPIGLVLALIGVIRQAQTLAQETQYADASQMDATIFYRQDPGGDRVIERIEFTRRNR